MTAKTLLRATAATSLGALLLAGCADARDNRGHAANKNICIDYGQTKTTQPAIAPQEGAPAVEECVRRWAYSLAPSRDDADTVAEAAVGACTTHLTRWNRQTVSQPGANAEAASIITGETTTPIAEHYGFARSRALLYVVQARAGNCAPPPAKGGVPEGVG